jgi:hypothetical protein
MIKLDRNMSGWINQTILSHLIDLDFKPKYDKCDGPEMNTNKINSFLIVKVSFLGGCRKGGKQRERDITLL